MLPRFGVRMFVNEKFRNVTYYGMGPYESYIDKHRASVHGTFSADIDKLYVDYIRPQENGSHCDCDYVSLKNDGEVHMEGDLCARAGGVHMEGDF